MYDLIIKNGKVIDGFGQLAKQVDIGIKEDKIVKLGSLHNEKGEKEIDAQGKIVCPGFIDVNNHSDTYWQLFFNPNLESLIYQGITTIVGGNCGSSLAPLATPATIESIQKWIDLKKINVNWLSLAEFFDVLAQKKIAVNFATLVGQATLRRGILKDENRSLVSKELNFIKKSLQISLKEGALGMSTGLIYSHARQTPTEEIIDLVKVVKKYQGIYTTHIRGEDGRLVESIEEAIKISKESGIKLHISHLKAVGKKNWSKMDYVLSLIDRAYETGISLSFDVYPYTNTGSVLYALLPNWVSEGGKKIMLHRLRDPQVRTRLIVEMKKSDFEYDKVEILSSSLDKSLTRRKITDIAKTQSREVEEAIIDLLIASEGRVTISADILSEDNIRREIIHPLSIIATNGVGYSLNHSQTGEVVHPRSFGSFVKVLTQYVLQEKILSLEEAIKKMTSFPAQRFGIKKRGGIKKSYFADILIINEKKLASLATQDNPYQYAQGVEVVIVNGKILVENGQYQSEAKNGYILKK